MGVDEDRWGSMGVDRGQWGSIGAMGVNRGRSGSIGSLRVVVGRSRSKRFNWFNGFSMRVNGGRWESNWVDWGR